MSRDLLVDDDRVGARTLQLRSLEEMARSHVECVLQATARHCEQACRILDALQPRGTCALVMLPTVSEHGEHASTQQKPATEST